MGSEAIAVVEPQTEGVFHAPFNAALLHTVAIAYPAVRVAFHAMLTHAQEVKEILCQVAPEIHSRVEWHAFPPSPSPSVAARWRFHHGLLRQVLALQQRTLFCSISRMQLLQLKRLMRRRKCAPVRAVLHGELDLLEHATRSILQPFSLGRILSGANPKDLRYLLLGRSIRDHIPAQYQAAFANAGVCDHPYHFAPLLPANHSVPVFGIFGNAGDGRILESVARQVQSTHPHIRFRLIGFVSGAGAVERLRPFVEDVENLPVSRHTFIERAQGITHALWLAPADSFRLRASGTFFDALSYVKPLIYTANPFIDSYHAQEPNIGVRCETLAAEIGRAHV